jgi:hypothetical protein
MNKELLDFGARIAWPIVGLIGILILGPGGVLKSIIGELADKLFKITSAVESFRATANDFHKTQEELRTSTQWVTNFEGQIKSISEKIESISSNTDQLAISDVTRSITRVVHDEQIDRHAGDTENRSPDELFTQIRGVWENMVNRLRERIGDPFDARSIGEMAWRAADRRRANPISSADAELIERLHSQMKRFIRLQNRKEEWLTFDIFTAFTRGVEQAIAALG